MKKVIAGILAFLYLTMSSGVVLEVHYCMGKIASVDLLAGLHDTCSRCGMKEKKGSCCRDELKIYKLDTEHKNITNLALAALQTPVLAPAPVPAFNWQEAVLAVNSNIRSNAPPDDTGPSRCIRNCVFRI